jgi:hypothetical protein
LARVPAPLTQHRLVVNGFVIDESDIGYNLSDLDRLGDYDNNGNLSSERCR